MLRNPSWRATKAGAWVTFGKKPTRSVETGAAPALPLGWVRGAAAPELPQAASPIAATASRAVTAAVRRRPMKRVIMACSFLGAWLELIPTKSVGKIHNTSAVSPHLRGVSAERQDPRPPERARSGRGPTLACDSRRRRRGLAASHREEPHGFRRDRGRPPPLAAGVRRGRGRAAAARRGLHDAVRVGRRAGVRAAARRGRRRASSGSAGRASTRSPAACTRPATAAGRGRSGSSPASATPSDTNERFRTILDAGGGGLSVAFDMPTLMGRDSDDPRSLGEVGHCGVAIDSAADMDVLFAGIPLADVTTSMTISGPAVPIFCMYVVAAERQGADVAALNGTLQTDIFKEYIAQKEWLFPPEPHLRLIGDLMEWTAPSTMPALQAAVGVRLPHPGGRLDGRAGAGLHPRRRVRLRRARACARPGRRRVRARACRSSSTPTSTSSRRSPSSARPAGSGPGGCATSTARARTRRSGCASTPRPPGCRSPRSSPTTTSSVRPSRRWPPCSAARTRCTPTLSTRCWRCRARRRPRSRCAPSR